MLTELLGKRMKFENLKSGWFAVLLIVVAVGLSGCCSDRCRLFGQRNAVEQVIPASTCGCEGGCGCDGALAQYQGEVVGEVVNVGSATRSVGSTTRTADVSSGSGTKNCGST